MPSSAAMSAKPSFLYFNGAGRVFAVRVALFKAFGKDGWEDRRLEFSEWAEMKPKTPLGSLPVLTLEDGLQVTQTDSMLRWAAKKAGLYPSDETKALLCDELTFCVIEALSRCPPAAGDEGKAKRAEYAAGLLAKICAHMERGWASRSCWRMPLREHPGERCRTIPQPHASPGRPQGPLGA